MREVAPCPATKLNAKVDQEGCSGEQPVDDECLCDGSWKNHGGYVTCVAHAAEAQLEAGLLCPQLLKRKKAFHPLTGVRR